MNEANTERTEGDPSLHLEDLDVGRCSCVPNEQWSRDDPASEHLEAYAAASALARRLGRGDQVAEVLDDLHHRDHSGQEKAALRDTAALVAHALRGPVAVLDPAEIVLTGSLAFETVRREIETYLQGSEVFSPAPTVTRLEGNENKYVRARGAALAVVRQQLYRSLESLVGSPSTSTRNANVARQTLYLSEGTWEGENGGRSLIEART